jgi:hypothetical protein
MTPHPSDGDCTWPVHPRLCGEHPRLLIASGSHTVHPRLCGEHSTLCDTRANGPGSSPPVRGTPTDVTRNHDSLRFIPACAGNTSPRERHHDAKTVHPRLCGEHPCPPEDEVLDIGSSPPVRGTPGMNLYVPLIDRFIPACAGNTDGTHIEWTNATVHPRLCGEHRRRPRPLSHGVGSSPPVRGTPFLEPTLITS